MTGICYSIERGHTAETTHNVWARLPERKPTVLLRIYIWIKTLRPSWRCNVSPWSHIMLATQGSIRNVLNVGPLLLVHPSIHSSTRHGTGQRACSTSRMEACCFDLSPLTSDSRPPLWLTASTLSCIGYNFHMNLDRQDLTNPEQQPYS